MMKHRKLAAGELRLSELGLGCGTFGMNIGQAEADRLVHMALDQGINFFDTADVYGGLRSEAILGQALKGRRADAVVTTKFGMPTGLSERERGASRPYIRAAVDASLSRLRTEYIDLYQLHVPDPRTPIVETIGALEELVKEGKIRLFGAPALSLGDARSAERLFHAPGRSGFASMQLEYDVLSPGSRRDIAAWCLECGIGVIAARPLRGGLLAGKQRPCGFAPRPERAVLFNGLQYTQADPWTKVTGRIERRLGALAAWARARERTLLELAFGWLLSQDSTASVVAGASAPAQLVENVSALSWRLSVEEIEEVASLHA